MLAEVVSAVVNHVVVGLGVRDELLDELLALPTRAPIGVLEVMIDDGLAPGPRVDSWRRLGRRWPLIAHGTELGVGNATGVDSRYVDRVAAALRSIHALWYSEHLSFLEGGGQSLGHFGPLSSDEETRRVLAENSRVVRDRWGGSFLLENPADVLGWECGKEASGAALGAVYARQLEASASASLLDLTNLVLGARNDGYSVDEFLSAIPLERVVEIHLAGGHLSGSLWIDSHDHDVDEEALSVCESLLDRTPNLRAVVIERDDRLPPLSALVEEVSRVHRILSRRGRA